ncbi:subtilisin-like protein [Basidiobolus meristosporus CBS 931.73]|uniref:Subtilisin-like protein n=1 Tax=Basidiobolus meristosporus CBS 931.73 TaxID=1314790 RepID=A0A1Y1X9M9_9FUNG|nr:subtilisin-like protein [Basidiobolus meristosporus CBS 931.73]|eukprot:ORX82452.1 subtilisin-like protein [Basidiobolus meristosporus CBS 931.73]
MIAIRGIALVALVSIVLAAPLLEVQSPELVNRYVVKFKSTADTAKGKSFNAFAGVFSESLVRDLKTNGDVEYIEAEQVFTISGSQSSPPSWGLPRVSQRARNPNAPYTYPDNAGSGVDVYIIDTGINVRHSDFGGRASLPVSFINGEAVDDLNGHGTHVAGTVGGTAYGVAKKVNLIGVKVLSGAGSGSTSGIIAGVNWVAQRARSSGRRSVANMSLGGGNSEALKAAVNAAVQAGVSFIVAAGNESQDACNVSPANASGAFTVAATTVSDTAASFTNYGQCVNIAAPGKDITSAWIGGTTATNIISGTSMASPHVAGVAALYLAQGDVATPQSVYNALSARATKNIITGLRSGTPNLLVYNSNQ